MALNVPQTAQLFRSSAQNTNLQAENNDLRDQIAALRVEIAELRAQVTTLDGKVNHHRDQANTFRIRSEKLSATQDTLLTAHKSLAIQTHYEHHAAFMRDMLGTDLIEALQLPASPQAIASAYARWKETDEREYPVWLLHETPNNQDLRDARYEVARQAALRRLKVGEGARVRRARWYRRNEAREVEDIFDNEEKPTIEK